jgi:hypothetical protein
MKIVGMVLEVTTHRLLLRSNSVHCFLIKAEVITEVSISVPPPSSRKPVSSARSTS